MAIEGEGGGVTMPEEANGIQRKSPHQLKTLAEVLSSLSAIQSYEAAISTSLSDLVSSEKPIINSLGRLELLKPRVSEVWFDAELLSNKVAATAQTARHVGDRVRALDEEMKRVKESITKVGQVMELKSSLQLLHSSIESKDYDGAARHCSRAMAIPSQVINGPFAEVVVPTADYPSPPAETLEAVRGQLLATFTREFSEASAARDAALTSRFFKLFPLIGWETEGLEVYAQFVVDLIRRRPPVAVKPTSPMYYIAVFTALFEHVAQIIDQHQPVVKKHYGPGKMTIVISRLLEECDRIIERYLDGWKEERGIRRKLDDTSKTHFASSIATLRTTPAVDETLVDAREIDKLNSEMAGMASRCTLFCHFVIERIEAEIDNLTLDLSPTPPLVEPSGSVVQTNEVSVDIVTQSSCKQRFYTVLMSFYLPLEIWYLKFIIDKALRVSSVDSSVIPSISTAPDDVFYLLKNIMTRLLSTGFVGVIKRVLTDIHEVVDAHYTGALKRKLDEVYIGHPPPTGSRSDKGEREIRLAYITHLNDLEVSASHLEKLINDMQGVFPRQLFFREFGREIIAESLVSLNDNAARKMRSAVKAGIEQLFNQLVRPRLRQLMSEVYKDLSYILNEDSYAIAESQDMVVRRFTRLWEAALDGFKNTFVEVNYRSFFALAVDMTVRLWEKSVMSMKYTELGAIRLDRDIRSVMAYLSSQTSFGDAREKFQRLQHISTLLTLDMEEDVEEFYSSSGVGWKVSMNEAHTIIALRI